MNLCLSTGIVTYIALFFFPSHNPSWKGHISMISPSLKYIQHIILIYVETISL